MLVVLSFSGAAAIRNNCINQGQKRQVLPRAPQIVPHGCERIVWNTIPKKRLGNCDVRGHSKLGNRRNSTKVDEIINHSDATRNYGLDLHLLHDTGDLEQHWQCSAIDSK
jgi:hypothetical protein